MDTNGVDNPPVSNVNIPVEKPISVSPSTQSAPPRTSHKKFYFMAVGLALLAVLTGIGAYIIQPWSQQSKAGIQATPPPVKKEEMLLSLESPGPGSVAIDNETLVRGKTLPGSTVLIYTNSDDVTLESDSQGNFETTIMVSGNDDILAVNSVSPDGQEKSLEYQLNVKPENI